MSQFGDIVSVLHESIHVELRFDIKIDSNAFYSILNLLDLNGVGCLLLWHGSNQLVTIVERLIASRQII